MSLLTILSLGSAFLNVAQAGHSDDVKSALYIIKDLPKSVVEPYCSKLGSSGKGAGDDTYTVTKAQYTITTTLDCSKTGGYGSKPWKTSEPEVPEYGHSAPSPTYGAEYGQVTSPTYGSEESSHGSHGGPPGGSSEEYGSKPEGSYEDPSSEEPSYGGESGEEPYYHSEESPYGYASETDVIVTLTSTTTSTYFTTSTVYFFGTETFTGPTSYITLFPAKPIVEPLYEEVEEEGKAYKGGEDSWRRSAKFLHRRAEWCEDRPCRLVQYADDVIAEACKQYGAEGGYPVGKATTVTEYGPATETVTPTTCDSTEYPESTDKPKGGYGGHEEGGKEEGGKEEGGKEEGGKEEGGKEEGGKEEGGKEEGGFKWPSKSSAGSYGSEPEETPYGGGEEHGHGKPSHGGYGGHGKPTGYESAEYGSESTSAEESWGAKPTGHGGEEHGHGKPSFGGYGHEEASTTEKAWGAESTSASYGGEEHSHGGYGGHGGHGGHGKPSFGGFGHEEPTSSEAAWSAEATPTSYGGGESYGHGGYGKPSGPPGGWGHDEPTTSEAAWSAESTPTSYGGEEHGHGKPSGEWGAKPSGYGGGEHGGPPAGHGDKGGKPVKMCKVKYPKAKA